ncbi:MAG: malto-oligosyltrehalose synthase [Acetobacteraceae bacterium]
MIPRATYRLQFHKEFGFEDAAELVPYLARLGISHLYASSYLKARSGSSHGYDIIDHGALNPELGDLKAFERMNATLFSNGMKQILDFVPNHMGVGGADNPLWLDVLEWGSDSDYAGWFDIDWDPDQSYLRGKLLAPVLGDQYGAVLESGELVLKFDPREGSFAVWAYNAHKLPVRPLDYARVLGDSHPELERLGDAFSGLWDWRPQVARRTRELKARLAGLARTEAHVREALAQALARINGVPGDLRSWQALDALIRNQHWRVADFRVAADDINYRRFFNINDLAGIRMEIPEVFEHTHRLVLRLLAEGILDGLRIDHIDGLLDPKAYLERLRGSGGKDFYLVVEKILARHEALPEGWPVDGTTGYDFTNLVFSLLIDPAGEGALSRAYVTFTGEAQSWAKIVQESKIRIMENEMASELNGLAREAARVARQNPRTADFTRNLLRRAIRAVIAGFSVYRTYIDAAGTVTRQNRNELESALAQARRSEADLDPSVFDFLAKLLSGDLVARPRSGFSRHGVLHCAMKMQQYSGPVMAKGLEDTAFYRYNRFVALNEVGGDPAQFGMSLAAFHEANRERALHWPHAMLATATHDTKRGEDTRARLAVVSELARGWSDRVRDWSRSLRSDTDDADEAAPPDRKDEYMLFQLLVGSWPVELLHLERSDPAARTDYAERLKGALVKSVREAKVHSTWAAPDHGYERAMLGLAERALDPERSKAFLATFLPFAERIARLGARNSLVQTVLKLTLPGVPDIYQGAELWDLSLVDPDNRRPVDYAKRCQLLDEIESALARDRSAAMQDFMQAWPDGRCKLATILTILQFRNKVPDLFAKGDYEPLWPTGSDADVVCAYLRRHREEAVLVAVARFPARGEGRTSPPHAKLVIPESVQGSTWRELLRGRTMEMPSELELGPMLGGLPAAVFARTVS